MQNHEVADVLQGSQNAISALLSGLPEAAACWRPGPAEWSIQEVLGHLIETEQRSFGGRIRLILEQTNPQLADWDPEAVGRARDDNAREMRVLLAEFNALRSEGIALVRRLEPPQLERMARHPYIGSVSVRDHLYEWIFHDCDHLRQMHANLQAYVWPSMGSTQKFYPTPPGL